MKTSKQFYSEFNAEMLAKRKLKKHTKLELSYLKKLLTKEDKILDLACGYGRFTIPLAKKGYSIEGIDITPGFIKKAKETSSKEKVKIRFKVGDMRDLPYKRDSFTKIICMWSAFSEIITRADQKKSIKEMFRVLKKGGFALAEMRPKYNEKIFVKLGNDERKFDKKKSITSLTLSGIEAMPNYVHSKKSLRNLMKECKISKYNVFIDDFGGRERLFLQFWKK
ncbi:MAG: hypothetical protein CL811_04750 [Colwelliaceae bacterium]|nr:hypothetical protein [Colwelliaceae bacterium]|tara:strand:+ start:9482 stop:10150 length:669 start_codon:yes stop_codon:yes gene_type:complete